MAERAGIDPNRPVPIDRILQAARSREEGRQEDRSRSDASRTTGGPPPQGQQPSSSGRSQQRQEGSAPAQQVSLVPGFGVSPSQSKALSFGEGIALSTALNRYLTSPVPTTRSGSSAGDGDRQRRIREFAESMLRRNDRNNSGRLERDEWGELRGNPEEIDRNKDGVITLEELEQYVAEFARRREGGDGSSGGGGPSTPSGGSSAPARSPGDVQPVGTRFVRFRHPHELLPPGLPDWFIAKDKDQDGQVSMAEYSSTWNDAVVAEFLRYDLDGDGIITPRECLAALAGAVPAITTMTAPTQEATAATGGSSRDSGRDGSRFGDRSRGGSSSATSSSGSSGGRSAWDDPGSNFW